MAVQVQFKAKAVINTSTCYLLLKLIIFWQLKLMKQHPTMYTLRKNIKSSVYYVVFILLGLKKSSRKKTYCLEWLKLHRHGTDHNLGQLTCAVVWDPRERLWGESRRLFMVKRWFGRVVLMVAWIANRFLSGQDHRRFHRGLLSADAAIHWGSEFNGC